MTTAPLDFIGSYARYIAIVSVALIGLFLLVYAIDYVADTTPQENAARSVDASLREVFDAETQRANERVAELQEVERSLQETIGQLSAHISTLERKKREAAMGRTPARPRHVPSDSNDASTPSYPATHQLVLPDKSSNDIKDLYRNYRGIFPIARIIGFHIIQIREMLGETSRLGLSQTERIKLFGGNLAWQPYYGDLSRDFDWIGRFFPLETEDERDRRWNNVVAAWKALRPIFQAESDCFRKTGNTWIITNLPSWASVQEKRLLWDFLESPETLPPELL